MPTYKNRKHKRSVPQTDKVVEEFDAILASDDEFPDDFIGEVEDIPAYLRDGRFNSGIQFPWLSQRTTRQFQEDPEVEIPCSVACDGTEKLILNNETGAEDALIFKCMLKKIDVISIQHVIDAKLGDAMVLWFINFLINRDLRSDYKFKSCLVADYTKG
ncbi:hypothetical protein JYU34_003253 [Plutella xylostella]|uniref:Uncharacterized protein n=1 Tax=Plutella xylostella TaxID=51655 RepID=A0ABQ7QZJ8_PLUXY|nr:hypothetical protein JYU34_003253 [Plutella xylostella]